MPPKANFDIFNGIIAQGREEKIRTELSDNFPGDCLFLKV